MFGKKFDIEHGMNFLKNGDFDSAEVYFKSNLEGNSVAHYGLALARFRKDPSNITVEKASEVGAIFERAVVLDPGFADAYFMGAMAFNTAAGLQLGAFNKDIALLTSDRLSVVESQVKQAALYFSKAISLNPAFRNIAVKEIALNEQLKILSDQFRSSL